MKEMTTGIPDEKNRLDIIKNAQLSPDDKLMLALVTLGKKPATFFGRGYGVGDEPLDPKLMNEFSDEFLRIKKVLEGIQVPYKIDRTPAVYDGILFYRILAAKEARDLPRLAAVVGDQNETVENATELGRLMGYPETAIAAYRTDDQMDIDTEVPPEEMAALKKEGLGPFFHLFAFSRSHWAEEVQKMREWRDTVREKCPQLFSELLARDIEAGDQVEVFQHVDPD